MSPASLHRGSVLGVDLSARMLERARAAASAEGLANVRFEQATPRSIRSPKQPSISPSARSERCSSLIRWRPSPTSRGRSVGGAAWRFWGGGSCSATNGWQRSETPCRLAGRFRRPRLTSTVTSSAERSRQPPRPSPTCSSHPATTGRNRIWRVGPCRQPCGLAVKGGSPRKTCQHRDQDPDACASSRGRSWPRRVMSQRRGGHPASRTSRPAQCETAAWSIPEKRSSSDGWLLATPATSMRSTTCFMPGPAGPCGTGRTCAPAEVRFPRGCPRGPRNEASLGQRGAGTPWRCGGA